MTMNQQDRDALTQNWDQAKEQIRSQFPGVTDADLDAARSNPDQAVSTLANKTGQTEDQVRQALSNVAQQFSQGQGGQSQGQRNK